MQWILSALALSAPGFVPAGPLLRAGLAIAIGWAVIRAAVLGPRASLQMTRGRRVPPRWDVGKLARAAAGASGMVAAWHLVGENRWLGGALFAYALTETCYSGIWALALGVGVELPVLHRDPLAARSVGEFWLRWNTTVGDFLRTRVYARFARRGRPRTGAAVAFAISAGYHAYVGLVALDWRAALALLGYFVAQGLLIGAERAVRVARWPRPLAHGWVVAAMLASSPLFVGPLLRVCAW